MSYKANVTLTKYLFSLKHWNYNRNKNNLEQKSLFSSLIQLCSLIRSLLSPGGRFFTLTFLTKFAFVVLMEI